MKNTSILCPITCWKERVAERGRGVGNLITERKVIAADNMNWMIGTQRKDSDIIIADGWFCTMRTLFQAIGEFVDDPEYAINNIIGALVEKTGIDDAQFIGSPMEDLEYTGRWVDSNFKTSFMNPWPPTVYHNIFKESCSA